MAAHVARNIGLVVIFPTRARKDDDDGRLSDWGIVACDGNGGSLYGHFDISDACDGAVAMQAENRHDALREVSAMGIVLDPWWDEALRENLSVNMLGSSVHRGR